MSYGQEFVLTLFTNDPALARRADQAGINRIGLDLEQIGKAERQGHLNTWISDHTAEQLSEIAQNLRQAQLFVRTNPIHAGIQAEVDCFIAAGVQVLMLPMFQSAAQAARFIEVIDGRAEVSLLIETPAAAEAVDSIVTLTGIDEIHIGLNDLRLGLGLASHFDVLGLPLMDKLAESVTAAGIPFGFGGIGRRHDPRLPVPSDLVYAQYPRLNADRALVSRVFVTPDPDALDLVAEVGAFRARMDEWRQESPAALRQAQLDLGSIASRLSRRD
jgi:hypothetical protein